MAIYPCSIGMHRYPQAQQSAYFSELVGSAVVTSKARLCPKHFRAIAEYAFADMDNVTEGGQQSSKCQKCDKPRATTVFLRLFAAKSEEAVFALDLCPADVEAVREVLQTSRFEPLGER